MRRGLIAIAVLVMAACARTPTTFSSEAPSQASASLPEIQATDAAGQPITYDHYDLLLAAPEGSETKQFVVYDAADPAARAHGLMQVTDLPADAGMLFRFGGDNASGFWMKNTLLPLSIAFADTAGVIVDVLDMEPCKADPCPVYTPDRPYRYALEVNQGVFAEHGIAEGWKIQVPEGLPPAA